MPVLDKFRQYHYESTVKVSDNTRTLALSAIAIVWLFKHEVSGEYQIANELLSPLIFVLISLALDFAQHVYRSIAWHIRFRLDEGRLHRKEITEDTQIYAPEWINIFSYIFFYGKVVVLAIAYFQLMSYFNSMVKWV